MDANWTYVDSLLATWNEWEIRMLVLTSLALQVFLLFSAGIRKRNVSAVLSLLLWLAYLLADSIAIYALGYLSQMRVPKGVDVDPQSFERTHRIQAFWAPFLLLHLGGQDTITAFSTEDNELWKRHLLSLLTQVRHTRRAMPHACFQKNSALRPAGRLKLTRLPSLGTYA